MYLDFFQLQREPFQVTPDPAFFYFSPGHREALAALIYGVEQRKGFIAVTGEVGVGKTAILRTLLEEIDQGQTKVIYLLNADVAFDDLLKMLLQESGSTPEADHAFPMVNQLHRILIEHFRQDRNVVLIIDEAQNMPVETLEGLRTLSNLETATDKLLQIVFCGQPEFDEKLARPELRQLKQRIAIRATVRPFTAAEGVRYIQHRLSIAGVSERAIFTKGAIRQILRAAQGIPRLINILCDNALVTAFGYHERQVTPRVAKEIIVDHKAQAHPRPVRWWFPAVGVASAAMVAGVFLNGSIGFGPMQTVTRSPVEPQRLSQVPPITEEVAAPTQAALVVVSDTPTAEEPKTAAADPDAAQVSVQKQEPVERIMPVTAAVEEAQRPVAEHIASQESEQVPVERIVKPGDRLLDLVEDVYGARDNRLVRLVMQHNPRIKNSHVIHIGDRLVFPPDDRQESTQ